MNIANRITKSLGFKTVLIGIMILIMLVPAALVREVVLERSHRADEVEREILDAWGGELWLAGPVLRIPCTRLEEVSHKDAQGRETVEHRQQHFDLWLSPHDLDLRVVMETTRKSRGIFSVPVFAGTVAMAGVFDATAALAALRPGEVAYPADAELVVSIGNQKGIRGVGAASWERQPLAFKPGAAGFDLLDGGVRAAAPLQMKAPSSFQIELSVRGGKRIRVLPLGEEARVSMAADWLAPSYQGQHLPGEHSLDDAGFKATWDVSYLSRGTPLFWQDSGATMTALSREFFGVDFFEVLDRYALNDRATKHAVLFIIVPFLSLFMLELFARRRLHPVQYLLAGVANMVYYLLLLSLSEHVAFGVAYLGSSLAVGVMVFLYSWSIFKDVRRAWYMAPVMGAAYVYLYVTLQSEDWALLIGSLGAFAITALVMIVTRNVNWYEQELEPEPETDGESPVETVD
ncbi:MAG: cell envelope integrity protein CreD [Spirochaetales bacterium]|nr:cell envelope integrity protein CreD [Spirochaetales bacterium]